MAVFIPTFSTVTRRSTGAMSRLLTAALIDARFRDLLLTDPAAALAYDYNDKLFNLSLEEIEMVRSIHATSLSDFARQILELQKNNNFVRM